MYTDAFASALTSTPFEDSFQMLLGVVVRSLEIVELLAQIIQFLVDIS